MGLSGHKAPLRKTGANAKVAAGELARPLVATQSRSPLLGRLNDFLPQLQQANAQLPDQPSSTVTNHNTAALILTADHIHVRVGLSANLPRPACSKESEHRTSGLVDDNHGELRSGSAKACLQHDEPGRGMFDLWSLQNLSLWCVQRAASLLCMAGTRRQLLRAAHG